MGPVGRWLRPCALLVAAVLLLPEAAQACESCRAAVGSDQAGLARGLNTSILFMLAMVFTIPTGFAWVVWRSYHSAELRAARGEPLAPPGAIRWEPPERG